MTVVTTWQMNKKKSVISLLSVIETSTKRFYHI